MQIAWANGGMFERISRHDVDRTPALGTQLAGYQAESRLVFQG
jgi:hypothetical protein